MNDFSPSELIYLYIDGEADVSQQAALFAALAHDSDLQAEFNDALSLRLSVSNEVRSTVPEPALKHSLLQKAGFTSGASAIGSVTTAHAPVAASWFAGIKGMVIPVLTMLSGIVMLATGSALWYNSTTNTNTATTDEQVGTHDAAALAQSDMYNAPAAVQSEPNLPVAEQEAVRERRSAAFGATSIAERGKQTPAVAVRRRAESALYNRAPTEANNIADENTEEMTANRMGMITSAATVAPELSSAEFTAAMSPEIIDDLGDVHALFAADESSSFSWGVQARGIIGLRLFPWREMGTASDVLDNTVIGATWIINDEHSAGVEMGREVLPMFVLNKNGELRETQSLMWGGVMYRYAPELVQLSDGLRPFVAGFAGGSVSGPLLKSTVGLLWKPATHIQFTLGAEGTFLMYRYQQQWYGTQKLGVSYGVTVVFP